MTRDWPRGRGVEQRCGAARCVCPSVSVSDHQPALSPPGFRLHAAPSSHTSSHLLAPSYPPLILTHCCLLSGAALPVWPSARGAFLVGGKPSLQSGHNLPPASTWGCAPRGTMSPREVS